MADLQAEVQAAADEMVAAGTETGLQVAVHRHRRVVVDVVSGVEDPQTAKPLSHGTLFYAASAAKGVAASLAHVLAERGDITYDLRLADVWPEFAGRGKEPTTLRHVLHTAGLPGLPRETTVADLCDWDRMCAVLAAAEPWWQPGSRFGYHALTFGFLLGETLRRVTGRTMSSWAFGYSPDRPGPRVGVPSRRGSTFGMVGANGSAAYADIDSGLAVAVMRNGPSAAGLAAVTRIDRLIAETEEHQ